MLKWLYGNTLKRRVFFFVLVIMGCFLSGTVYTFYATYRVNSQIEQMFQTSVDLNHMKTQLDVLELHVDNYLGTKDSDSFVGYIDAQNNVRQYERNFQYGKNQNPVLLQLTNISALLDAYLDAAQRATEYKRARNTEMYLEYFAELMSIRGFIDAKVDQILKWDYEETLKSYMQLSEKMKLIQLGLFAMSGVLIALSALFVYSFSTQVTRPITVLSNRAIAISEGNYDVSSHKIKGFTEAKVLEDTFDDMTMSIKTYIESLKDKVVTENRLRLSEIEKLKMQNLLNEAELMALQSQINPHFLFNTLNAGLQLAQIEEAERTSEFIESLSQMFRYNIQSLSNMVTLRDELKNVQNYAKLMKVRYGEGIDFQFTLDKAADLIKMPPLILQPLVENAIIHGFSNRLSHRVIEVITIRHEGGIDIRVKDNGKGMPQELVHAFNQGEFTHAKTPKSHTTGLGLGNVYERLRHIGASLSFRSDLKKMTEVVIQIPDGGTHA